jgi:anti-sigma factor RsiW
MTKHLSDDEVAAAVAGVELEAPVQEHLASCLICHRQVTALRDLVEARRAEMAGEEPDWESQRVAVLSQLGDGAAGAKGRRWLRPALAAAAAVAMAIGVGLMQLPGGNGNDHELAVEEILAEADALLEDDSIPGFEVIDPGLDELSSYLSNGVS